MAVVKEEFQLSRCCWLFYLKIIILSGENFTNAQSGNLHCSVVSSLDRKLVNPLSLQCQKDESEWPCWSSKINLESFRTFRDPLLKNSFLEAPALHTLCFLVLFVFNLQT